jgi:hypothetical protein
MHGPACTCWANLTPLTLQGVRVNASLGLVDVRCRGDAHRVELRVPRPVALPVGTTLPMRVQLSKHWTAGLFSPRRVCH